MTWRWKSVVAYAPLGAGALRSASQNEPSKRRGDMKINGPSLFS